MLHVLSGPSAVEVKQPPSSSCPNHSMQGTVCFFRNPCLSLTSKKKRGPLKPSSLFPAASSVRFISLSLSTTPASSYISPLYCGPHLLPRGITPVGDHEDNRFGFPSESDAKNLEADQVYLYQQVGPLSDVAIC